VLIPPEGNMLKYAIQIDFPATNNIVEYEGLVTGLRLAKDLSIRWVLIRGDSQLGPSRYRSSSMLSKSGMSHDSTTMMLIT
jgi:hypothetical protein